MQQRETIQSIDVSNITLTDYSLKVDGIPKTGVSPEEIGTFFAKFGRIHMAGSMSMSAHSSHAQKDKKKYSHFYT